MLSNIILILFFLATCVLFSYLLLLSIETNSDNRFLSNIRLNLDEKFLIFLERVRVRFVLAFGSYNETSLVLHEEFRVFADKSVLGVPKKILQINRGEQEIEKLPVKNVSSHLKKLRTIKNKDLKEREGY